MRTSSSASIQEPSEASALHHRYLSVVVPAFNEAALIDRCLHETTEVLQRLGCEYEVIVVDDGSSDETAKIARRVAFEVSNVQVIRQLKNNGKGAALLLGVGQARGDLVAFVDADLEVHPMQITRLFETLSRTKSQAVIGSKHHPEAQVDVGAVRHLLSLLYSNIVHFAFNLSVHDTQTGLKLFEREPLERALALSRVNGFAHDLELLVDLTRLGYRIAETPVTVTSMRMTQRIRPIEVARMALDTLLIWCRYLVAESTQNGTSGPKPIHANTGTTRVGKQSRSEGSCSGTRPIARMFWLSPKGRRG